MDKKQRRRTSKGSSSKTKSSKADQYPTTQEYSSSSHAAIRRPSYIEEGYLEAGHDVMYQSSGPVANAPGSIDPRAAYSSGSLDSSALLLSQGLSSAYNDQNIYNLQNNSNPVPIGGYLPTGSGFLGPGLPQQSSHLNLDHSSTTPSYSGSFGDWSHTPVHDSGLPYASFGDASSSWQQANTGLYSANVGGDAGSNSAETSYYGSDSPHHSSPTQDGSFRCEVEGCGKMFTRSYNYKAHLETHDEKREYPFHCPMQECSKKFARKTDLQRHHQSVHMKERNHGCAFCGRCFARKDTLRRHMEDGCSKRFDIETIDLE